jgi:hypothetical protein
MTAERDREVGFAKTKTSKLTKDVEIAKAEIERLQSILQVYKFDIGKRTRCQFIIHLL